MKHNAKALAVLPLALAVSAAFAADDNDYTTLDTSVISVTGYAQDTREAPGSISVITNEELMTKPITDIASALVDVPGVDIDTTKMGTSQIRIRGFSSNYTLIMVDGRSQNNDPAMNSQNGFEAGGVFMPPPGAVERIEVIRGPASTIYGSDAIGGAVNIIMKKQVKKFTGSLSVERTQFEDSAYGNRWGTGAYLGIPLKEDVASLLLRGRYIARDKSDLHDPTGAYATHSASDGYTGNIGGRLSVSPNADNDLYLDLDFTHFKGGSMSTSQAGYEAHRWFDKYAAVIGHEGRYKIGELSTYFQFQGQDLVKTQTGPATKTNVNPNLLATANKTTSGSLSDPLMSSKHYTLATKLKTPLSFGDYGDMILQTGLNFDYSTYEDNFYFDNNGKPVIPDTLDHKQAAVFAEGEYFINENWIATLGGRLQWSDIFDAHFSPRAYLVWKPMQVLSFKGGVANGYRAPAIEQMTDGIYSINTRGQSTSYIYGNPDLKPEESWNYELSATLDFPNVAQLTAGVFYTDFKNQLDQEEFEPSNYRDVNRGKVEAKGVEVMLKTASFNGFSFTGGYTLVDSKIKSGEDEGKRSNNLPRHTLTARLDYQNGDFNAYLKSLSKFDSRNVDFDPKSGGIEKYKNYTTVDLGVNYTYAKQHHFSVALNNIFDVGMDYTSYLVYNRGQWTTQYGNEYRDYLDGRNLWLNYTYTF